MKVVGKQDDGQLIFQIVTPMDKSEEHLVGTTYINGETLEDFGEENLLEEERFMLGLA